MEVKDEEKYLMFFLNDEYYGIPILKVNELIGLMECTHIPNAPKFMKGIINLRGRIIPIIDLRLKFKMPEKDYDDQTCIIILSIPIHDQKKFVGLLVDRVAEVVNIYNSEIEAPPEYNQECDNNFLTGIGKMKGKVVMLLDIDAIINCQEIINFVKKDIKNETDTEKGAEDGSIEELKNLA